jgi:hypothetical protein
MWRRMERFYHCYLDIWFDSSLERAIELDGEIDRLFALDLKKRHSIPDWHLAREPAQRHLEKFIDEVRKSSPFHPDHTCSLTGPLHYDVHGSSARQCPVMVRQLRS